MKNLEEKMNELFQITSSTTDSQIKGELQLNLYVQNFTSMRKNEKKENNLSRTWKKMCQ